MNNSHFYSLGVLLFLLLPIFGFSQIEIGIKGGYTNAWPGYGDLELPNGAETHISSYNVSLFLDGTIRSTGNGQLGYSLSPGFVKRGAACFPGWTLFVGDSRVFLNYIELPIQLTYKLDLGTKGLTLIPSAGYGISYLASAFSHTPTVDQWGQLVHLVAPIAIGEDNLEAYNRLDHGIHLSARLVKELLTHHLIFFESAYYHGMTDYDPQNVSKNRNINLNFGFGYRI